MTSTLRVAFVGMLAAFAQPASGQDAEYVRAIERAQEQRPSAISAASRIAPLDEPGTRLTLHGRIVMADGTPAAGTIVFAYHTDREGLYDGRAAGVHSWRLKGWARADAEGRFTFETIRPGAYPDSKTPAHVHFTAFTASGERYHAGEVKFEDDTLVPQRERDASQAAGEFGEVRPVREESGASRVHFALRIDSAQRF